MQEKKSQAMGSQQAGMTGRTTEATAGAAETSTGARGESGMESMSAGRGTGMQSQGAAGAGQRQTGEQDRSEQRGMDQMSAMLQESHEEGDPELQQREQDLRSREECLKDRERCLKDREEQLRTREQGLKQRETKYMGRGLGATDYTNYQVQNTR